MFIRFKKCIEILRRGENNLFFNSYIKKNMKINFDPIKFVPIYIGMFQYIK